MDTTGRSTVTRGEAIGRLAVTRLQNAGLTGGVLWGFGVIGWLARSRLAARLHRLARSERVVQAGKVPTVGAVARSSAVGDVGEAGTGLYVKS
jgi:hypothetical protein